MAKHILFLIITIGLLVAGCIRIPDNPGTAGQYNKSGEINTACFTKDSTLPSDTLLKEQQFYGMNSQNFRVLNWNSYKGNNKIWREDFERLSSISDVVVLQEVYLTEDLQVLLDKKSYNWDIAQAFTYNDISTGVLTASRIKPDFLCSFRASEPLTKIPKTILITRYPLAGSDEYLVIANTHMINFSLDLSAYRAQLDNLVAVVSQHRGPLIISGDFNTWNKERMRALNEVMQGLGLREIDFDADFRTTFLGHQVDHIFYRKLIPLEALTEKVMTSDHNPMLVTFRLDNDV